MREKTIELRVVQQSEGDERLRKEYDAFISRAIKIDTACKAAGMGGELWILFTEMASIVSAVTLHGGGR